MTIADLKSKLAPNYLLCIMWMDTSNNVHRYKLWEGVGEVIFVNIPLYTGQMIAKNFRLEIWSTNVGNVGQAIPVNFFTSVLGGQDYRWNTDAPLANLDNTVTALSQQAVSGAFNLPFTFPANSTPQPNNV